MKFLRNLTALCTIAMLASAASAHPGHDHMAWSSPVIHAALGSLIGVVFVALGWYLHRRHKQTQKSDQ